MRQRFTPLPCDRALAFLHLILGSLKLIEEGESKLAFLRRIDDPPLTGGSGHKVTLLCSLVGSRKLVGKGDYLLALMRLQPDPSLTDGSDYRMAFLRYVVGSHN